MYKDIRSFEDVLNTLNITQEEYQAKITNIPSEFRSIYRCILIRKALNEDYSYIDPLESYYPYLNKFKVRESDTYLIDKVPYHVGFELVHYGYGLRNDERYYDLSYCNSFLQCATRNIALHFAKYFTKDLLSLIYYDKLVEKI